LAINLQQYQSSGRFGVDSSHSITEKNQKGFQNHWRMVNKNAGFNFCISI